MKNFRREFVPNVAIGVFLLMVLLAIPLVNVIAPIVLGLAALGAIARKVGQ